MKRPDPTPRPRLENWRAWTGDAMNAKRYPCPRDDCDGVFRENPSTGHGTEWECSKCGEGWPK